MLAYPFKIARNHISQKWIISIPILLLMAFFLFLNAKTQLESYTSSDWLINYQGGFIRRGLIGQIIYMVSRDREESLWSIFFIQALASIWSSWLILKIYFSCPKNRNWLIILLSPAFFFVYSFYDISASLRKELLVFLSMSLLVYGLRNNRCSIAYLRASWVVYIIAVYSHELASLCIPFFIYPLYIQSRNTKNKKNVLLLYSALFTATSISGLIVSSIHKGNPQIVEKICHSLALLGFSDYACKYGSIQFLTKDLSWSTSYVFGILEHLIAFPTLFIVSLFLSFIPIFCTDWLKNFSAKIISIFGGLLLIPLFITGIDWGRWIHIYIVLLSLCLLYDASHKHIKIKKIPIFLLMAYIALWTLPPWFEKPNGIFKSLSTYLPQAGILDRLHPFIFPPLKDINLKKIDNDQEYANQLTSILKNYQNIAYYPIEQNSEHQMYLSRLSFAVNQSNNLSLANTISPLKIFNTKSKKTIALQNQNIESFFMLKSLDPNTLYAFPKNNPAIANAFPAININTDLMVDVGPFILIAPKWRTCATCSVPRSNFIRPYNLELLAQNASQTILFSYSDHGKNPLMISGWQPFSEGWGTWSDGKKSQLAIPTPLDKTKIQLDLRAFIAGKEGDLQIGIKLNNGPTIPVKLENFQNNLVVLNLPNLSTQNQFFTIEFNIDTPKRPKDYGLGSDERLIGIGLKSIHFLP